jgi:hypothetical protein
MMKAWNRQQGKPGFLLSVEVMALEIHPPLAATRGRWWHFRPDGGENREPWPHPRLRPPVSDSTDAQQRCSRIALQQPRSRRPMPFALNAKARTEAGERGACAFDHCSGCPELDEARSNPWRIRYKRALR